MQRAATKNSNTTSATVDCRRLTLNSCNDTETETCHNNKQQCGKCNAMRRTKGGREADGSDDCRVGGTWVWVCLYGRNKKFKYVRWHFAPALNVALL